MENLMVYLAKATILPDCFLRILPVVVDERVSFVFTRFTLISGLIVCTILPFVKLKLSQSHALQQTVFSLKSCCYRKNLKRP